MDLEEAALTPARPTARGSNVPPVSQEATRIAAGARAPNTSRIARMLAARDALEEGAVPPENAGTPSSNAPARGTFTAKLKPSRSSAATVRTTAARRADPPGTARRALHA